MNLSRNKKAELTTQQIVGLIILIVSFSVILFLIFRLNLGETTNKEICHNSVVLKSKSSLIGGDLDCRTDYICISGGRECEGINPTSTVDIDMNPKAKDEDEKNEKIRNETMKAIADEMADCWWMFGEGKIDYAKGFNWEDIVGGKVCALCSRIAFDKNIDAEISYNDLYEFMNTEKKDNTHTYLQYLGIGNFNEINKPYLDKTFDFSQQYYVLTGISKNNIISGIFGDLKLPGLGGDFEEKDAESRRPLPVVILKETSEADCTEFVTKA